MPSRTRRNMAVVAASFSIGAAAVAIACSSPTVPTLNPRRSDGGGDGGDRPVDEVYAETYAEGLCAYYEKCVPQQLSLTGEGAACRTSMVALTTIISQARGRSTDLTQLRACLAKLGTPSCAYDLVTVPECAFKGSLRDGEACAYGGQCGSGICSFSGGTCGVCSPTPTCAGGCGLNTECTGDKCEPVGLPGDPCGACSTGLRCSNGTCLPGLGEGADCTSTPAECDFSKGLVCLEQGGGLSACRRWEKAQVGQKCGDDTTAHTRTYCDQSYCGPSGTCVPKIAAGQPVPDGGECAFPLRNVDGFCAEPYASCR